MGGNNNNTCLRWDDFESNLAAAFYDLREESDFFDVTLGCGTSGKKSIQAHRVILSACSNFFKTLLRNQAQDPKTNPNPYIYLKGISFNDLTSIVDFMYYGEVNVPQDNLTSFLNIAEELKIKGLVNKDRTGQTKSKTGAKEPPKSLTYEPTVPTPTKTPRPTAQLALADFSNEKECFKSNETESVDVKSEELDVEDTSGYGGQSLIAGMIADYENNKDQAEFKENRSDGTKKDAEKAPINTKVISGINEERRVLKTTAVRKLQATYTSEGLKIIPIPFDDEEEDQNSNLFQLSIPTKTLSPMKEFVDKEHKITDNYIDMKRTDVCMPEEESNSENSTPQSPNTCQNDGNRTLLSDIDTAENLPLSNYTSDDYFGEYGEQLDKMLTRIQNDWSCKMCGKKSDRKDNMRRHVENVHAPRVLQCKLCSVQVRNHQTFYRHMKVKHGLSKYKEVESYKKEILKPGEELVSTRTKEFPQAPYHSQVKTRYIDKRTEASSKNNTTREQNIGDNDNTFTGIYSINGLTNNVG